MSLIVIHLDESSRASDFTTVVWGLQFGVSKVQSTGPFIDYKSFFIYPLAAHTVVKPWFPSEALRTPRARRMEEIASKGRKKGRK